MKIKPMLVKLMLFMLLLALQLAGCGQPLPEAVPTAAVYSAVDCLGNRVELDHKPMRIVSLTLGSDEILLDLVGPQRLQAVTYLADDGGISNVVELAAAVPHRVRGESAEALLMLEPDLVIVADFVKPEMLTCLREWGLKVYCYRTPSTIAEIKNSITALAQLVGEEEQGAAMCQRLDQELERIREFSQNGQKQRKTPLRTLYMYDEGAYYMPQSSFRELCHVTGVQDVLEQLQEPLPRRVGPEEIVKLDPQLIIIGAWDYDGQHTAQQLRHNILNNPAYASTEAVGHGAVAVLPSSALLCCSQYIVKGAAQLAAAVQEYGPDIKEEIEAKQ